MTDLDVAGSEKRSEGQRNEIVMTRERTSLGKDLMECFARVSVGLAAYRGPLDLWAPVGGLC